MLVIIVSVLILSQFPIYYVHNFSEAKNNTVVLVKISRNGNAVITNKNKLQPKVCN